MKLSLRILDCTTPLMPKYFMPDDKKKNISSALDKMESEYALRAQENHKVRINDKIILKQEIQTEKSIKEKKAQEYKELQTFEFRSRTTQAFLILVLAIFVGLNLSSHERTTLIEYSIYIILIVGTIAAKKKS